MNIITTTELRTKTTKLVEALLRGRSVNLVHRSRIIGKIKPIDEPIKKFDAKKFKKIVEKLNLPHLTNKEIERRYRKAMVKKHGEYLL
jgi:antitoxin (DNA-binding transcriptional repressor) of toxin-antitoxin stability system